MPQTVTIGEKFCFHPYNNLTANISNLALRKYADGFESAKALEGNLPIILDTNILLGYYGMSQSEKGKLMQFINKYRNRIKITKQVELEYLRNRLSVIKKDFFTPLHNITDDYSAMRSDIMGKLQSFNERKKRILSQDYPLVWEKVKRINDEINSILFDDSFYDELNDEVGTTAQNNKNITYVDDLLELVSQLEMLDPITDSEIAFLKNEFETLIQQYNSAKDNVKWKFAVPGCGDQKEDASGDSSFFMRF